MVMDSQLRLPLDSKMVRSAACDLVVATTSAASAERRRAMESRGIEVLVLDGPGGRADLAGVIAWLGRQRYLSLMIEAGSKLNWTALETGVVDRIFFYYGPKILGGLEALPLQEPHGEVALRRIVVDHENRPAVLIQSLGLADQRLALAQTLGHRRRQPDREGGA